MLNAFDLLVLRKIWFFIKNLITLNSNVYRVVRTGPCSYYVQRWMLVAWSTLFRRDDRTIGIVFCSEDDAIAYINCIKTDILMKKAQSRLKVVKVMDVNAMVRQSEADRGQP